MINENIICLGEPMIPTKCMRCGSVEIRMHETWLEKMNALDRWYECIKCGFGGTVALEVVSIGGKKID